MKNRLFIVFLATLAIAKSTYAATTETPNASTDVSTETLSASSGSSSDNSSDAVVPDNSGTDEPSSGDDSSLAQQTADALAAQKATSPTDAPIVTTTPTEVAANVSETPVSPTQSGSDIIPYGADSTSSDANSSLDMQLADAMANSSKN
ncbi:MAG: hypothetical protein QG604_605 [Candidatus Dependentiae bacterium]|nr:hypothetical protein [Candidatus Dependentiae bacterium]